MERNDRDRRPGCCGDGASSSASSAVAGEARRGVPRGKGADDDGGPVEGGDAASSSSSSAVAPPRGAAPPSAAGGGGAASSLMGLFEPPPPSSSSPLPRKTSPSPSSADARNSVGGTKADSGASVAPPPPPPSKGGGGRPGTAAAAAAGGGASSLMGLFEPPPPSSDPSGPAAAGPAVPTGGRPMPPPLPRPSDTPLERQRTERRANRRRGHCQGADDEAMEAGESSPLLPTPSTTTSAVANGGVVGSERLVPLNDLFRPPPPPPPPRNLARIPPPGGSGDGVNGEEWLTVRTSNAKSSYSKPRPASSSSPFLSRIGRRRFRRTFSLETVAPTLVGSFTYALYHVVFALAQSSAIVRPSDPKSSILAPMSKMCAIGIVFSAPLYVASLGGEIPALYPTTDLFLAPFLAKLAAIVDDTLQNEGMSEEDDGAAFLTTFAVLASIGSLLSSILCLLGSKFKLANLGAYLPYPVLCGFFSAVGLLLWELAFRVDTSLNFADLLSSADGSVWRRCALHHLPSLIVGIFMHVLGRRRPVYITLLVLATVAMAYVAIGLSRTTLEEARDDGWFWKEEELVSSLDDDINVGGGGLQHPPPRTYGPPAPFGVIYSVLALSNDVNWTAVRAGLPTASALATIYLLRCSLHAAALKKNVPNVTRERRRPTAPPTEPANGIPPSPHSNGVALVGGGGKNVDDDDGKEAKKKKKSDVTMLKILRWYGNGHFLAAIAGGFCTVPSIAASSTMFNLGAEGVAPQYGSILLLLIFYLTNFRAVSYVPKPAFSCLLVLAFLDLAVTWFYKSFRKSKNKSEWVVVPLIVTFTYVVGMLESVALGVAFSTFIFVRSFYATGVVKFIANGLTIRSTIERNCDDSDWLDANGDLIQVLVLQNYLFFGNASSCLRYVDSMFEEPDFNLFSSAEYDDLARLLPPIPKYLILDLTMVTGMDASAADVIGEIVSLCEKHACEVYVSGPSSDVRSVLSHAGVTPAARGQSIRNAKDRRTMRGGARFFSDLETALGKAEDSLLTFVYRAEEERVNDAAGAARRRDRTSSMSDDEDEDDGFRRALRRIDEQHGLDFCSALASLRNHARPVELEPGDVLFDRDDVYGGDGSTGRRGGGRRECGLYFIERGLLKVERDSSYSVTRSVGASSSLRRKGDGHRIFATPRLSAADGGSIGHLKARTRTIGREAAMLKVAAGQRGRTSHSFRLGRFGPGWVVGTIEQCAGLQNPGVHVAVTSCRLHHLRAESIRQLEETNPALVLRLLKLISHLMARRQEVTIEQLATLHSIMTSPAPTKPVSRTTMAAVQNAMSYH